MLNVTGSIHQDTFEFFLAEKGLTLFPPNISMNFSHLRSPMMLSFEHNPAPRRAARDDCRAILTSVIQFGGKC